MKKNLFLSILLALFFSNFVKYAVHKPRKGKDYAIFFAVNQYQSNRLMPLQNPMNDAKQITEELKNSYDFETEVIENPTYEIIEHKLKEYNDNFNSGKFDRDGQLLIFFSGHGFKQLSNGYFLPSNANPDDLKRTAISYKLWQDDINAIPCKHILVAIDACYSGTFDPKFGMRGDSLFGTRTGELSEGERLLTQHQKSKTRLFFTSGETNQPTPDKSDFAKKFLQALLSKGFDDKILTSSEMFSNYLERANPRPRSGEFGSDEAGSSFLFISKESKSIERPEINLSFEPEMVFVKGGTFKMGSNNGSSSEQPIHSVTVKDFSIGKYEITQKEWYAVMGSNPSKYKCDNCPIYYITWEDIQEFVTILNEKTNKKYRLPSEAEWEYAAKGGLLSKDYIYSGSNFIDTVAWYNQTSPHPVGQKKPNELGIYDMSGNVFEICQDVWHDDYINAPTDGSVWLRGGMQTRRVFRGGSCIYPDTFSRIAKREPIIAQHPSGSEGGGFRLVRQ